MRQQIKKRAKGRMQKKQRRTWGLGIRKFKAKIVQAVYCILKENTACDLSSCFVFLLNVFCSILRRIHPNCCHWYDQQSYHVILFEEDSFTNFAKHVYTSTLTCSKGSCKSKHQFLIYKRSLNQVISCAQILLEEICWLVISYVFFSVCNAVPKASWQDEGL